MDCDTSMSVLDTPIKKIRELTLSSPRSSSTIRYPNINDFGHSDPIFHNMVEKGYSQTISNKVLLELDSRASEISTKLALDPAVPIVPRKQYSSIHRAQHSKMESISAHYAASRAQHHKSSSPTREFPSSATKKRRTLNGPEEIFGLDKENDSPSVRKGPSGYVNMNSAEGKSACPTLLSAPTLKPGPQHISLRSSPIQDSSPTRIPSSISSSPEKFTRISPSKGSMNLNLLLHDDEFVKPEVPKHRQSSLQMAGVDRAGVRRNVPTLQKKSSIPTLQKKPSIPTLQKKPSIPTLQKKPSIPTLHKKPSIPSLQRDLSTPTLHKKTSIPSLQTKKSIPNLQKKQSMLSFQKPAVPQFHTITRKSSSQSLHQKSLPKKPSELSFSYMLSQPSTLSVRSLNGKQMNNVTVPQPFSLYNKPTISSSQKSLDIASSLSSRSLNTFQTLDSQRLFDRFQNFKNRFS